MSRPAARFAALLAVGALCATALAAPAAAQTFTPAPSARTLSGTVTISSPSYTCVLTAGVSINPAGGATVGSRSFGGPPLCSLVIATGAWTLAAGPGTGQVTLHLEYTTVAQRCYGTAVLPFTAGAGAVITFTNVSLTPAFPGGGLCTVNGQLVSNLPLGINP